MTKLSFIHRFVPATSPGKPPLLLLHGTGGDENDLISLGEMVAPGAALLSPRGKVLEGGAPRFFRRLREGVFDEDDLRLRTGELADFVAEARTAYDLPAPIAMGFSNGANIAAAMLMLRPEAQAGAILLRAMPPLKEPPEVDLKGTPILLVSGTSDPIITAAGASRLAATLTRDGAVLRHEILSAGHGLTQADVTLVRQWLAGLAMPAA
jgi:phospholipase/carboxylesterase